MKTLLGLLVLTGCGIGIHRNPTTAVTAPYHDHQDSIRGFAVVRPLGRHVPMPGVGVGSFVRYYPLPIGFHIGKGPGAMRSWGRGTVLTWAEIRPQQPAEETIRAAFANNLGTAPTDAALTIEGVVTEAEWYELGQTHGGRITTKVVVVDRHGQPVFEGERSTTARANTFDELIIEHVDRWLADPQLVAALQKGGAR